MKAVTNGKPQWFERLAHVALDDPYGVAELLDRLRAAGAREQATALAGRLRRPACSGSSSTRTAPQISSVSDGRLTAPRPRHGAWEDLDLWLLPVHGGHAAPAQG